MTDIIQGWQCPICNKVHSPVDKTCNCQNKRKRKEFVPPTLEEVKAYFKENGFREDVAERAWKGYDAGNWHDSKGNQILVWKQKMQHVWFKDEHKEIKKVIVQIPTLKRL